MNLEQTDEGNESGGKKRAGVAFVIVAMAGIAGALFYVLGPLGGDVSWLLTATERFLAGQKLYAQILEPNPPMAVLLYVPPVALAAALGLPPEVLVVIYTAGLAGLSGWGATAILKSAGVIYGRPVFWLGIAGMGVLAAGENFAQREHFAVLASLPVFALAAVRAKGSPVQTSAWIAAGLCGGLMMAIKPHFAAAILFPALCVCWVRRSPKPLLAPEHMLAGVVLLLFWTMVWFCFPEFFSQMLPLANQSYLPDRRSLIDLLTYPAVWPLYVLAVPILAYYRRAVFANQLAVMLLIGAGGFLLAYFVQGKGFEYHAMPAVMLVAIALLLGVNDHSKQRDPLFVGLLAIAMTSVGLISADAARTDRGPETAAVAPFGPGLAILNLTAEIGAASPLHRVVDGQLVNSGPGMLMTLGAVRQSYETGTQNPVLADIEVVERRTLLADMQRLPPDIIVTSRIGFDWMEWARQDDDLAALLAGFDELAEVPFIGYPLVIYKRRDLKAL